MKYLIVGLGNIGEEYDGTRHNIGFEVVESLGKKLGGEWKSVKHGSLCEVSHKGRKLLLGVGLVVLQINMHWVSTQGTFPIPYPVELRMSDLFLILLLNSVSGLS